MVAAVPQTTNFALNLPPFDYKLYHDLVNANFQVIDAILNQYLAVQNVVGVWQNSTAYTVGQRVIDDIVGTIYNCNIAHTSAATPTTFAQDRANNPTYWSSLSQAATARGIWTTATQYQTNDFVVSGSIFAVALDAHISGSTFAGDHVHWAYLIDLSSFSIPSGVGKALQYLRQNATETGQEYVPAATVLAQINDPAILAQIQAANIFTAIPQTILNAAVGDFLTLQSTDAGAGVGPTFVIDRNSASPAVNDVIGAIELRMRSSTNVTRVAFAIYTLMNNITNGAENASVLFRPIVAGTPTDQLIISGGLYTPNATGTAKGTDSFNTKALYIDGVAVAGRDNVNMIVNPDCAVAQLGTTIAAGALNDNAYTSDGTRVLLEANGDCSWTQLKADLVGGIGPFYSDSMNVVTTNKKFGFFKPIENSDLRYLTSTSGTVTVIASFFAAANASIKLRAGLLAWTSTADAISGDPISAWNADGTNPTLAANWAYCNTPVDLGVTGVATTYSIVCTVPVNATNLALFIWNDSKTTTAAHVLRVGNYDLRRGNILLPFEPINYQVNLARCQRYAPVFDASLYLGEQLGSGFIKNATSNEQIYVPFKVPARIAVTGATISNPTNFVIENLAAATAVTALAFLIAGVNGAELQATTAALTAGQACILRANNTNCRVEFTGARL